MILVCLFVVIFGLCMVSFLSAGKDKDFNKFMGNFRN